MPSLITSLKKSAAVNGRRHDDVRRLVKKLGRQDFDRRHPDAKIGPVLALIASYLEADNIGPVLKAVPAEVSGLEVTTLVVVDGGDDGTEDIVEAAGCLCAVLPVNMGQGVALQLGYEIAESYGCRYVVTIDADGQNDPAEVPDLLAPLIADESDFVIASRRRGTDETTDSHAQIGCGGVRRADQQDHRQEPDRHLERLQGLSHRGPVAISPSSRTSTRPLR